ncbi:MAG: putative NAD/FAD-binding protein [Chlamydiales bacterium]
MNLSHKWFYTSIIFHEKNQKNDATKQRLYCINNFVRRAFLDKFRSSGGEMKTAIVGSGVAGLMAAYELFSKGHEVTVFEAKDHIGGHVWTIPFPVKDDVTGEEYIFPVELGVFMHDPKYIHPVMNRIAQEWGIKIKEFLLTFTCQDAETKISWSTESKYSGIMRNLFILLKAAKDGAKEGHGIRDCKLIYELTCFLERLPEVSRSERYRGMSLQEFLAEEKLSDLLRDDWILPQVMCWWGSTREVALSSSIQVLADSINKVSVTPQYIFEDGWDLFMERLAQDFREFIRTGCPVTKISRSNEGVEIFSRGSSEKFDAVVLAVPPNIALLLLDQPSDEEEEILSTFETATTKVYMHTDTDWMPKNEKWSVINLIGDERGYFCTFWGGGVDERKPKVFLTWGDSLKSTPDDSKIFLTVDWLRTLPTVGYSRACKDIRSLQGINKTWYCGAHVHALDSDGKDNPPSLWHDNALRSGQNAARMIEESVMENDKSPAKHI